MITLIGVYVVVTSFDFWDIGATWNEANLVLIDQIKFEIWRSQFPEKMFLIKYTKKVVKDRKES